MQGLCLTDIVVVLSFFMQKQEELTIYEKQMKREEDKNGVS